MDGITTPTHKPVEYRPNSSDFSLCTTHDQPIRFNTLSRTGTTPVEGQTCEGAHVPDDTSSRHFGIEDESTGFFELSINGRRDKSAYNLGENKARGGVP